MEAPAVDYLRHFGLERDPFGSDPMLGFHFDCPRQQDVEQRLLRGPLQAKGLSVLIGGYGSGKTTLLRRVVAALPDERFEAAVMVMVRRDVEATAFLQRIARLFGVPAPSEERVALIGQLAVRLNQIQERGLHAVALIDEAQMLCDDALLDELRGLLNLEGERGRLLSLVLSGRPSFETRLSQHPDLLHRVELKARLEPFDAATTARYLAARVAFARGKPGILHPAAVATLHALSRGVPRVVNTLADNALYEAYVAGRGALAVEDVERVAHDLGIGQDEGEIATAEAVLSPYADYEVSELQAPEV
jgi:type II secretory pathway predicted ATPase ExeA